MSHPTDPTAPGLDLARIDLRRVRQQEDLFFLLCSASFVKSAAALRMHRLIAAAADDPPLQTLLRRQAARDERLHGHELAAYVRHVWPEFAWDKAFKTFCDVYARVCEAAPAQPRRSLDLAACCAAQAGSASRYRALHRLGDEPVLMQLTNRIKNDDVDHFKQVCRQLRLHRQREGIGRFKLLRAMRQRLDPKTPAEHDLALRHIFNRCYPLQPDNEPAFRRVGQRLRRLLRRHGYAGMTVRMLLKPLDLPGGLQRTVEKPLIRITDLLFSR